MKKHPAIINLSLNKKTCISKLNEQDYLNHETFVKKNFIQLNCICNMYMCKINKIS